MEPLKLEEIQEIEMEILDEIHSACEKLGIPYFLAYGSLIGAYRHGGFIPWDDDMDICLLREDYEKLLARFDEVKASEKYKVLIYRDGVSNLPYAKIADTSTRVDMKYVKKQYATGIWVDIFPFDYIETNANPRLLKEKLLFYRRVLASSIPAPERPAWQNAVLRLTSAISSKEDPLSLARKLDEAAKAHSKSPSDFLCDIVGSTDHPVVFKKEWFKPVPVNFESRTYLAPENYDEILTLIYGDWKTPPPEEERLPHGAAAYRLS